MNASQNIHWEKPKDALFTTDYDPNVTNMFRVVLKQIFVGSIEQVRAVATASDIAKLFDLQLERLKVTRMSPSQMSGR